MIYEVTVIGRSREVYRVEAASEQDAREGWSDSGEPFLSEVDDVEVTKVEQVESEEKPS